MGIILEYIWLDGYAKAKANEVANLRSKIKVISENDFSKLYTKTNNEKDLIAISVLEQMKQRLLGEINPSWFPQWSFDGSSTMQAEGKKSDCVLNPVYACYNTIDKYDENNISLFVLCEVLNPDGTPHETNTRSNLIKISEKYKNQDMWFAFEQEYALFDASGTWPHAWPSKGFPSPQGRYYCGVGADVSFGRNVMSSHLNHSLQSGLPISGTNAEVMPSQWEFQIGPNIAPIIADQMWMSRYILNRVAEKEGVTVKLSPKPVSGDWNGTGCHVNFSNKYMRNSITQTDIDKISNALEKSHKEHLDVYGEGNEKRLTGNHETCSIHEFRIGESDRGASIRIPPGVLQSGKGYLEDRRPAANIDPYEVCSVLLETVCSLY